MSDPIKEHQVPRSYLERFADKDKKIWVFDKQKKEPFHTHITNVAAERNYYDTPDYLRQNWKETVEAGIAELGKARYIEEFIRAINDPNVRKDVEKEIADSSDFTEVIISHLNDPKYLEKILSNHESLAKTLIDDVLQAVKRRGYIKQGHKTNIAFLIVVQYVRTKAFRNNLVETTEGLFNNLASDPSFDHEDSDISVHLREGGDAQLHIERLLDVPFLDTLAKALNNHICRIGINTSKLPLYTSDQPVVRTNRYGDLGFASYGVEFAFPLAPDYIILFFEKEAFRSSAKQDRRTLELKEEQIIYYNSLQVEQSYRQIFCAKNRFNLVEKMYREKPHLFDLNRPRVKFEDKGDIVKATSL